MMLVFFFGMGLSAIGVSLTQTPLQMGIALTVLGVFSAIYHPVGIPMLVQKAKKPGFTIGVNGLAGGGTLTTNRTINIDTANLSAVVPTRYPLVFWDNLNLKFGDPESAAYGSGAGNYFYWDQSVQQTKFNGSVITPVTYIARDVNGIIGLTSTSPAGTAGTSGIAGTAGTSGTSATGAAGTAGTSGISGTAGTSGTSSSGGGGGGFNPTADYIPYYDGTGFSDSTMKQDIATGAIWQTSPGSGNGEFWANGNIIAFYSDERLKKDFNDITNALDKVKSLRSVTYYQNELADGLMNGTYPERQVGVIAQDVEKVLPEAVKLAPFDRNVDENGVVNSKSGENYLTVQYEKIVP
jgi:hypothetical protein